MTDRPSKNSTYLGDGLYADIDEAGQIWLFTFDGIAITNRVALEPYVLEQFLAYIERVKNVVIKVAALREAVDHEVEPGIV